MGVNRPNLDAYFQVDGVGGGRNRAKSEVEGAPRGGRCRCLLGQGRPPGAG